MTRIATLGPGKLRTAANILVHTQFGDYFPPIPQKEHIQALISNYTTPRPIRDTAITDADRITFNTLLASWYMRNDPQIIDWIADYNLTHQGLDDTGRPIEVK